MGYLSMLVQGMRAEVKLDSKPEKNHCQSKRSCLPFHASAKVICLPLPVPLPMKEYLPSQLVTVVSIKIARVLLRISASFSRFGVAPVISATLASVSSEAQFGKSFSWVKLFRVGLELRLGQSFDFLQARDKLEEGAVPWW